MGDGCKNMWLNLLNAGVLIIRKPYSSTHCKGKYLPPQLRELSRGLRLQRMAWTKTTTIPGKDLYEERLVAKGDHTDERISTNGSVYPLHSLTHH